MNRGMNRGINRLASIAWHWNIHSRELLLSGLLELRLLGWVWQRRDWRDEYQ